MASASDLLRDLRRLARGLAARPAFTLLVVATLALGIGANTAIFSVVNGVLIRSLPYPDPDRLVMVWGTDDARGETESRVSYPDFRDWRETSASFEDLAAYWTLPNTDVNLTGGGEPERVPVARVTAGYFEVLGVTPVIGRGFRPEENVAGNHRVAVLSHGLWQRRFAGDLDLVGRSVQVNGFAYTVVGVLPADFRPLGSLAFGERVELWRPLAPDDNQTGGRDSRNLRVVGRLNPGVSLDQAREELAATARVLERTHPDTNQGRGVALVPLREQVVRGARPALLLLLGAVALVLLSACTNVANMLLARAGGRRGELAIRRALGASRRHLVAELVGEGLLLGLLGGVAGAFLAYGGIHALVALGPGDIPRLDEIGVDLRVLGFTLALSLGAGLLVGFAPAWYASSVDPGEGLRHGARTGGATPGRNLRRALVLSELTLTVVLLAGALLLVRSFEQLLDVDPGFDAERLLTFQLELPMATKYPEQWQRTAFFEELLERIERDADVRSATMVNAAPLGEGSFTMPISVNGFTQAGAAEAEVTIEIVGPAYFRTLGVVLLEGRTFEERDDTDTPAVAIVNETAARRWVEGGALGGRVSAETGYFENAEVVGIVRDVHARGLDAAPPPVVYLPHRQVLYNFMTFVVRTAAAPRDALPTVRAVVRELDPEQPMYNVRTMTELISRSVGERRFHVLLLAAFSGVALLLALAGVYGVTSYTVAQRTRDIGVRVALGARPGDVWRAIVREAAALGLLATAVGLPLALLSSRLLATSLFGISAADPWSYALTTLVIFSTAILAAFVPARRAAAVDPTTALRTD
jgi:putative ABC transport system permease protein